LEVLNPKIPTLAKTARMGHPATTKRAQARLVSHPKDWFGEHRDKVPLAPEGGASLVAINRENIRRDAMRNTRMSILVVLVGLFAVSVPASAHHGNASYDYAKTITVKGTVTQWVWLNPHCLLKFDVKNDKGEVEHWVTEASSPVDMLRIGWSSTVLKPGDEITIDVMPSKNGVSVGRIRQVTLSDGTVLKATTRNTI
jgi:hypothetical protein